MIVGVLYNRQVTVITSKLVNKAKKDLFFFFKYKIKREYFFLGGACEN